MTRGTWATYQGVPCYSVTFRRSRGYTADTCEIVVPADGFPSIKVGDPAPRGAGGTSTERVGELAQGPFAPPAELEQEGTLVLYEGSDGPGQLVEVPGLFVLRADVEEHDGDEGAAWIKLTLVDERFFAARGVLGRWRFNELLDGGQLDLSTAKPDGSLYTRTEIAEEVAASIFRGLRLVQAPERWALDRSGAKFPPFGSAVAALQELAEKKDGAAVPCLRLGGGLAFHAVGEGAVGYASRPDGPNDQEIPPQFHADEEGRGQAYGLEAGYPEQYVIVVGEPTVATVVLDDWEPCLVYEGRPLYLSEELVRLLTGGKFGLRWLRKVVMVQGAFDGIDLDPEVAELFATQAYRAFRLPGAERIEGGFYTGEPGPNAHLVPILSRAETVAGRRVAPTIETYRWALRHKKAQGTTEAGAKQLQALVALQRLVEQSNALAVLLQKPNPLGQTIRPEDFTGETPDINPLSWVKANEFVGGVATGGAGEAGLDPTALGPMLETWRRIKLLEKDISSSVASDYAKAYKEKLEADDADGGTGVLHWELAEKLVSIELEALENRRQVNLALSAVLSVSVGTETLQEAVERLRPQIRQEIEAAVRQMIAKQQADRIAQETGRTPSELIDLARFTLNLDRSPDPRASLYDEDAGVVLCSELAGHTAEVVADPGTTSLVPCPVRVTFGATLRPRVDVGPGKAPLQSQTLDQARQGAAEQEQLRGRQAAFRAARGEDDGTGTRTRALETQAGEGGAAAEQHQVCAGGDNVVPDVLTDREGFFAVAFHRAGQGKAELVDLEAVPLAQAVPIRVPWTKLVPLQGEGNAPLLINDATDLARQAFGAPDKVEGYQRTLIGPWPVQCDGLISGVEIRSEFVNGVPCGFTTRLTIGGASAPPEIGEGRTRERGARA